MPIYYDIFDPTDVNCVVYIYPHPHGKGHCSPVISPFFLNLQTALAWLAENLPQAKAVCNRKTKFVDTRPHWRILTDESAVCIGEGREKE